MEKLTIASTLNSPSVVLNPEKNLFEFSGESRPENVRNFFLPIIEWLEQFAATVKDPCTFTFNFEYFNSTSAKYILDIFKILHSIQASGNKVHVNWHYEEDDEDMFEVGQEMSRMSGLTFEYIKEEV